MVETGAHVDPTARLRPPYRIAATAYVGPYAALEGPVVVGPEAQIRHGALVRGATYIDTGCVIGHGSEVARSVILRGASLAHFCFMADSIVGRDVNFGSHVVVSPVRVGGDVRMVETAQLHILIDGADHLTTSKLGTVVGDRCDVASGVLFAPASFLGRDCTVYPGVYVHGYYASGRKLRVSRLARALSPRPDLRPRVTLRSTEGSLSEGGASQ